MADSAYGFIEHIAQSLNFAMSFSPLHHLGNGLAAGERANKSRAVTNCWPDNFLEVAQCFDQLLSLKRARINTIGDQDQVGPLAPVCGSP